MANKPLGNTAGLKPNQLRRLGNLYQRRLAPDQILLPEQAQDLAALTVEMGRRLGLLLDRKGQVVQILVGGPGDLPEPDLSRLRRGKSRLAGYHLLYTSFDPTLDQGLLGQLGLSRWDYLASLYITPHGAPGPVSVAHLLPQPVDGQDLRVLEPFQLGRPPQDFAALVRGLEEELGRQADAAAVGGGEATILVSVTTLPRDEAEERLDELAELARTAGLSVVDRVIQRRPNISPRTLLGPGKLKEVLIQALRLNAHILIFDQELTPSQAHNLALATSQDLRFMDRTQLILDIFAQRAQSREGKLQVEMAQLKYLGPRLQQRDDALSRLTGGIGGRGPGETRLEIDRRRVRQRLHRLEREIKDLGRQRQRRRQSRQAGGLPIVSIVGYTNAGKSTLLNALTGSDVMAENLLFATLDPTTRRLRFPREREVIITDTVGFIRDLPEELKTAFAATLEELDQADLLLHVADAANPRVEEQIQSVDDLLEEMDLHQKPRLLVLNKMDQADPEALRVLLNRHGGVAISAVQRPSLTPLLATLEDVAFGARPQAIPGPGAGDQLPADDYPDEWDQDALPGEDLAPDEPDQD